MQDQPTAPPNPGQPTAPWGTDPARRCTAKARSTGLRCTRPAIIGGTVCYQHGGASGKVRAAANKRLALAKATAELAQLGHPIDIDPATAMLRMVEESAGNVEFLRQKVQELEQELTEMSVVDGEVIIGKAGVAGPTGSTTKLFDAAPHIWVTMYDAERDRLVRWAKACRDAGIDERRVQIAEEQGRQMGEIIRALIVTIHRLVSEAIPDRQAVIDRVWAEQIPGQARTIIERLGGIE